MNSLNTPLAEASQVANTANGTENTQEASKCQRHNSYYFDDDAMAILLVENRLFRIHRYYLTRGSEVFHNMFASPLEEGKDPDGACDEQPITLPGVTVREFEALMDYLYLPPHGRSCYTNVQQNLDLYLDILTISHRFLFDEIFQYVLQELKAILGQIPTETRINVGIRYGLEEWLSSAYGTLLNRPQTLTVDEAKALGFEQAVRLLRAREFMHQERLQIAEEDLERAKAQVSLGGSLPCRAPSSDQAVLKMFLL